MTSTFPSCSLVSPYFPDPSVARANTAASKIDAWSAYATLSLDATPESGPSSPTLTDGDYLGRFQDLQDRQHDVTATGNSSFHFHLQNPGHATANNGKEYPTCFAPTSALFHRDKTVVEEPDTADKLHQILNNLKIRCHTDVYKNPSSPDVSNTGETQSNPKISTPLSLSTQPRSLCAYNRQVYDATRSLYGTPSYRPTQMQHQYATSGNAPFLTGSRYLTDVADDYSPGMLSPQMVSNLENLISSPAPRSTQQMYEQLNEQHMDHKSGQLEGNYAWYLSQNRMENALHTSGNSNPDSGPYYGRPSSSTSDGSTSTLSSPERGPGKQRTATVMHGSNPTAWGFDTQAYLIDPIDGKHYGIAEEILAQQHAYPASFAPLNTEENLPASHSQVFHNIGSYTDAQQQAIFAPNHQIRTNRNLNSLAISTSGLNAQMSSSMTPSPLSTRRGSFDGDLSVFNSKSAVFGGPFQVGSRSYTQSPHQRRHSVSSNPPLSAASSSSSTAGSMTNLSSTSGGTASVAGAKEKKVSLYKTELCRSFEETGSCRYGSKCQFAHGQEELRTVERHPKHKSVMCKTFWEQGSCPYGQRCCFIHTAVPSDRGTVSIQSRAQFQSAPASGTSHSLPAKPPTVASSAIPTGTHKRQPSASLSTLYPVEDDAVINAINVTVDTSKLAKGLTTPSIPARTTSPTADKSTFGSAVVGSSSMQHRLRRASLGDAAEDVGATLNYKNKKSQCACTRIGGVGSCFSCSANVAKMHNHSRARTITSGELAYQQQQLQLQQLQQQQQQQPASRTARRSSLTEGGARRLPIFQSIQS